MITLYYQDQRSDKVYQASVEPSSEPGLYDVNFAYGRRGNTLTAGKKNSTPISKEAADKILEKLVREKMAKGYTPGKDGVAYSNTSQEERFTGILPMLLNAIPEDELNIFVRDENWVLQPKLDGKRMLIRKQGDVVEAINRKGLLVGAPQGILDEARHLTDDFILDGECIGEKYFAFDVVYDAPLFKRLIRLDDIVPKDGEFIVWTPSYYGAHAKSIRLAAGKAGGEEGVVFKELHATYTPGRPYTGGVALKCKFTATANVRVTSINIQRSVRIALKDGVFCGNVSIPPNKSVPDLGDIIEVRYLYAMPGSNALFQPVYSRLRDDIDVTDDVSTLKYKREED